MDILRDLLMDRLGMLGVKVASRSLSDTILTLGYLPVSKHSDGLFN